MRQSNFALRLQPSLMESARQIAAKEGVALNQIINVAVGQFVATHYAAEYIAERAKRANIEKALALLERPRKSEPLREGDELPEGWAQPQAKPSPRKPRRSTRSKSPK